MNNDYCRIHILALGVALGLTWGLGMLITGLIGWLSGWGLIFIDAMGSVYVGYDATVSGSLIGLMWGFVDAFVAGVVIAWLYNLCAKCCCKK